MDTRNIIYLADIYCQKSNRRETYTGMLCARDSRFFRRLRDGGGCTVKTYQRVLQWFSDNWPADLPWPVEISRPAPAPDSPAAQAAALDAQPSEHLNAAGEIVNLAEWCRANNVDGCTTIL